MANEEQKLTIKTNGDYKNIDIKTIDNENYIIVKKVKEFEKNGQYGKFYSVIAEYNNEEVSFLLNGRAGEAYKVLGNTGDTIKITAKLIENQYKKGVFYKQFSFDLIN